MQSITRTTATKMERQQQQQRRRNEQLPIVVMQEEAVVEVPVSAVSSFSSRRAIDVLSLTSHSCVKMGWMWLSLLLLLYVPNTTTIAFTSPSSYSRSQSTASTSTTTTTAIPFTFNSIIRQQQQQYHRSHKIGSSRLSSSSSSSISSSNNNNNNNKKKKKSLCSIEFIDQETGCEVVLLGCFHGSQSSAADVERLLWNQEVIPEQKQVVIEQQQERRRRPTDVVVLELCADRFDDLRHSSRSRINKEAAVAAEAISSTTTTTTTTTTTPSVTVSSSLSWFNRYWSMVVQTFRTKGLSTATAVAVLLGVSGLQTALSGLEPGLEFTTALKIASTYSSSPSSVQEDDNNNNMNNHNPSTMMKNINEMDIILADQHVDITLYKMGQLPKIAYGLWFDYFAKGWDESFGIEAHALQTALFGCPTTNKEPPSPKNTANDESYYVQLPSFLTRSEAAVQDLFRLTIPPFLLFQLISLSLSHVIGTVIVPLVLSTIPDIGMSMMGTQETVITAATAAAVSSDDPMGWLSSSYLNVLVANAFFLYFGVYLSVALPATRVILRERDDQLTAGIRTACQLATQRYHNTIQQPNTSSSTVGGGDNSNNNNNHDNNNNGHGRVVAVLGLLHVNGIAQRMLQQQQEEEEQKQVPTTKNKRILQQNNGNDLDGTNSKSDTVVYI